MRPAQVSVEVWRDSGSSAVITVYQGARRIDRVKVIPGDCMDLELEEGMQAVLSMMPMDEDLADELAAQDAIQALNALEAVDG